MNRSTVLVSGSDAQMATMARLVSDRRRLRAGDPAVRAMSDFIRHPPMTVAEDCDLDSALDDMFRLGVRAFLVVRALTVVGLITADDIRQARRRAAASVGEIMTPATDMPAIDWQALQEANVRDLMDIFEGAGVEHLVVLETADAQRAIVRGLVHRKRLERRLLPSTDSI